jgi:cyclopropane fatty-acyl-phospholipid synthase-like methyltransferase
MSDDFTIESMPLYTNLDRIIKGLAALGIGPTDPIRPEQLFPFDQWHYHGTDAIRTAAEQIGIASGSQVLDIGSGIGGPARFLAHTTGCHVTALELQPKLHAIGVDLTQRCGLGERVTHLCGDALSHPLPDGAFDAVVSWLAIHHIPERPRLCARLGRSLRPGGGCYIEDLCMRAPFAAEDLPHVRDVVFGASLTSIDEYVGDFRSAGFDSITATDMTNDWAPFVVARLAAWRENHTSFADINGEAAYAALDIFYAVIVRLFESGSLGGVSLIARVP